MSHHRRSCYCPSCQDWLGKNDNDCSLVVPQEDRDKDLCFIFLKEHRNQFIGERTEILVTSGHTLEDEKSGFKVRDRYYYSSYMHISNWDSYRHNKESYIPIYEDFRDPTVDKKMKSSVFYHISIIFPNKNFVYTFLSVAGMGGLRKIISNTRRLTKKNPSVTMKQSKQRNIGGWKNHDIELDKLYDKFDMEEPTVSCWL